jgi:hypothetical protein
MRAGHATRVGSRFARIESQAQWRVVLVDHSRFLSKGNSLTCRDHSVEVVHDDLPASVLGETARFLPEWTAILEVCWKGASTRGEGFEAIVVICQVHRGALHSRRTSSR